MTRSFHPVPRVFQALLELITVDADRRFLLADLEEELGERAARDGLGRARWWYRRQALASVLPCLSRQARQLLNRRRRPEPRLDLAAISRSHLRHRHQGKEDMFNFLQDLRYGCRGLRRAPLAMLITVLSLGLGIGAATAVFTLANTLLLRPAVGLDDPESLVTIYTSRGDGRLYGRVSYPDFESMRGEVAALEGLAAVELGARAWRQSGASHKLLTETVTGNYFSLLGIQPAMGRGFAPQEAVVGSAEPVVVISHHLWQNELAGDPAVLGKILHLDGEPHTVIGVAPPGLTSRMFGLRPDIWLPLGTATTSQQALAMLEERAARDFTVIARLRDGATLAQVQAQLAVLGERLHDQFPEAWRDDRQEARVLTVLNERDSRLNPDARAVLSVVMVFLLLATGLILLLACANVASVFLARASQRRREMALRVALGANRSRLVAMLLTESLLPGLASGGVGILLAFLAVKGLNAIALPVAFPLRFALEVDPRVLGFALLLSLAASLVFGLGPALEGSKPNLVASLKGGRSGGRGHKLSMRNLLVVAQVAASLVLVFGSLLFFRSMQGAMAMDLGMNAERIAVMARSAPLDRQDAESSLAYFQDLRDRLASHPEVEDVQLARAVELTILMIGKPSEAHPVGQDPLATRTPLPSNAVTSGYLEMLGVRLVKGRTFDARDRQGAPRVAVINETLARRFWPGEEALGQRFTVRADQAGASAPSFEVIGVAHDGKYTDIDEEPTPYFWTSFEQDPAPRAAILVKGRSGVEPMMRLLRATTSELGEEASLLAPSTLDSMLDIQFLHLRLASRILGWGGVFGLILAVLGIYGVVSFAVARRRHEMAIRYAVGARREQAVAVVVRDGMKLAVIGLVVGLLCALPLARLVRSQLFGVAPFDPLALSVGAGILLVAAFVASLVPAWRVTRLDPVRVLREE